jgi:deferrochelatase/peroxidase EfeB
MSSSGKCPFHFSRRGFLTMAGGLAAAVGAGVGLREAALSLEAAPAGAIEPFFGTHQAGIVTPAQNHTYFAVFDLMTDKRDEVAHLLKRWTDAAARLAQGQAIEPVKGAYGDQQTGDSGEAAGLQTARLTMTFGFGPGLFVKDGHDRYGLAAKRPEAFVDMPKFTGDQLVEARTGGDLSVQACADDPQVAFHAVRQLARLADGVAQIRWVQSGFMSNPARGTPRNLLGFKDGSGNPAVRDKAAMNQFVWAGAEAPSWMQGGSYLAARRIRIALEHWDRMPLEFQEQTVGRSKASGAPLGMKHEHDPRNLDATDHDGNPIVPENSHLRLGASETNGGAQILRRGYSYNDGANVTAERWPPWRQGMEYDAGLLFLCYQRDLRAGFIRIFDKMSKFDMMNQFVTHVGGGFFAVPQGVQPGDYIGQALLEPV